MVCGEDSALRYSLSSMVKTQDHSKDMMKTYSHDAEEASWRGLSFIVKTQLRGEDFVRVE